MPCSIGPAFRRCRPRARPPNGSMHPLLRCTDLYLCLFAQSTGEIAEGICDGHGTVRAEGCRRSRTTGQAKHTSGRSARRTRLHQEVRCSAMQRRFECWHWDQVRLNRCLSDRHRHCWQFQRLMKKERQRVHPSARTPRPGFRVRPRANADVCPGPSPL